MSRQEVGYRVMVAGDVREGALLVPPGMDDDLVREQARDVEDAGDGAVVVLDRGQIVGATVAAAARSNESSSDDGDVNE